ncbi:hypothetical protein EK904_005328 [Melospiza melodia maxima]|nr:hypothetical protein EK904_005328 [Melospiza melodia maxima]
MNFCGQQWLGCVDSQTRGTQVTGIHQIKILLFTLVTTSWEPITAGCVFGTLWSRHLNKQSSTAFKCSLPLGRGKVTFKESVCSCKGKKYSKCQQTLGLHYRTEKPSMNFPNFSFKGKVINTTLMGEASICSKTEGNFHIFSCILHKKCNKPLAAPSLHVLLAEDILRENMYLTSSSILFTNPPPPQFLHGKFTSTTEVACADFSWEERSLKAKSNSNCAVIQLPTVALYTRSSSRAPSPALQLSCPSPAVFPELYMVPYIAPLLSVLPASCRSSWMLRRGSWHT